VPIWQTVNNTPPPRSLDELSKVPCITILQGMPWRFKQQQAVQVKSSFKVNSGNMAKAAALKGLGYAILPIHACQEDINNGSLINIKLDHEPEDLVLYAFYAGRKYPLEKVKVFLEFLKSKCIELM